MPDQKPADHQEDAAGRRGHRRKAARPDKARRERSPQNRIKPERQDVAGEPSQAWDGRRQPTMRAREAEQSRGMKQEKLRRRLERPLPVTWRRGGREHDAEKARQGAERNEQALGKAHPAPRSLRSRATPGAQFGDAGAGPARCGHDLRERPRRAWRSFAAVSAMRFSMLARLQLVGLGQHDLVGHGRLVEGFEHPLVHRLDAVAGIDQQIDAREARAAAQIIVDQLRPGLNLLLLDGRIAVAGHVDEMEAAADIEEIELLRAARRVGGPGQRVAPGERIDEARFAHVRAARKGDLDLATWAEGSSGSSPPR